MPRPIIITNTGEILVNGITLKNSLPKSIGTNLSLIPIKPKVIGIDKKLITTKAFLKLFLTSFKSSLLNKFAILGSITIPKEVTTDNSILTTFCD